MRNLLPLALVSTVLLGAVAQSADSPAGVTAKDHLHLRSVKIMDPNGFAQPVAAFSLLVPKDWKVEGGVQWTNNANEMFRVHVVCRSADGQVAFEAFPPHQWQFSRDPVVRQTAAQSGHHFGPPLDALGAIRELFVPHYRPGASFGQGEATPAAARAAYDQAFAVQGALVQNGQKSLKTDAGKARLEYQHEGRSYEEWVTATITEVANLQALNFAALGQGQEVREPHYFYEASNVFAFRAPQGELTRYEGLFSTMLGSIRVNPAWSSAIAQVQLNIARIRQKGIMDRFKIRQEANEYVSDTINSTWQHSQESADRSAAAWSRAFREQDLYVDPTTQQTVELSAGYDNAWSNGLGEYILSTEAGFDPNQLPDAGQWTQLQTKN